MVRRLRGGDDGHVHGYGPGTVTGVAGIVMPATASPAWTAVSPHRTRVAPVPEGAANGAKHDARGRHPGDSCRKALGVPVRFLKRLHDGLQVSVVVRI